MKTWGTPLGFYLEMYKIIGLTGVARSGKDTFFECLKSNFSNLRFSRIAFADELKHECNDFLMKNTGISAFTEDPEEKEIIRPFLVTYGTHVRRRLNQNCWIDKIEPKMIKDRLNTDIFVITDVRFPNELTWIKSRGGSVIHIQREKTTAANEEEGKNDPILRDLADISLYALNRPDSYKSHVSSIIRKNLSLDKHGGLSYKN